MESSIAEFLLRWSACELPPTSVISSGRVDLCTVGLVLLLMRHFSLTIVSFSVCKPLWHVHSEHTFSAFWL